MGKYVSVIIGTVVTLLGLIGLIRWFPAFKMVVKGSLPIVLIFGGAIAIIAGLSELKDEQAAKQSEKK